MAPMNERDMVMLHLPFPPSANRLWRSGKGNTYISDKYRIWKNEAHSHFIMQRKGAGNPIRGNFTYHIILDEKRRKVARDGDNRGKCVLDFLQAVGLIEDDKFADGGGWSWGPIDGGGCIVRAYGKVMAA